VIRVFLDTNVLLDIELRRRAALVPIKDAAIEGDLEALVSFGVLEEVRAALDADDELQVFLAEADRTLDDVLREILTYTRFSGGFAFARRVLRGDPTDEPVLAAALAGSADVLVTSNTADFADAPIRIVTPDELLELLA
jgi:predicted nucleic acid-binding protein